MSHTCPIYRRKKITQFDGLTLRKTFKSPLFYIYLKRLSDGYRKAEIYIFDESTNAIDKITENKIIKNLQKNYSDKILIFISHKDLNKKFFKKRYILKNKRLIKKI